MATSSDHLNCPTCLQEYNTPKLLPCLHSICRHCLEKCIENSKVLEEKVYQFQCPVCTKIVTKPSDLPAEKWAGHFPVNAVLLSFLPKAKTKVDQLCDPCLYEGTSIAATSYCTTCKEALCEMCHSAHRKSRASREHTFLTLDETADPQVAVNLVVDISCTYHFNKDIEYYCSSHDSMCCSDCVVDYHRGCSEILKLKQHADKLFKAEEPLMMTERIKQLESHLDKYTAASNETLQELETSTKDMTTEIEKLIVTLHEAKSRISMEIEGLLEEESQKRRNISQQCQSSKAALRDSLHLLDAVVKYGNKDQSLVILHKIKEQLAYCEKTIHDKHSEVRQVEAKLQLNEHFISLRKLTDSQIAKIEITENKLKQCLPVQQNYAVTSDSIRAMTYEGLTCTSTTSIDLVPDEDKNAVEKSSDFDEQKISVNDFSGTLVEISEENKDGNNESLEPVRNKGKTFITSEDTTAVRECIKQGSWEVRLQSGEITVTPDYCSDCIVPDDWKQKEKDSDQESLDESWIKYESLASKELHDLPGSLFSYSNEEPNVTPVHGADGQTANFDTQEKFMQLASKDNTVENFPEEIFHCAKFAQDRPLSEKVRPKDADGGKGNHTNSDPDETFHGAYFHDMGLQSELLIPKSPSMIDHGTDYTPLQSGSIIIGMKYTKDLSRTGSQEDMTKDTDHGSSQTKTNTKQHLISLTKKCSPWSSLVTPCVKEEVKQDSDRQRNNGPGHKKLHLPSICSKEEVDSDEDKEGQTDVYHSEHHPYPYIEDLDYTVRRPQSISNAMEVTGSTDSHMVLPSHAGHYHYNPWQSMPGYQINYGSYPLGPYGSVHPPHPMTVQHVPTASSQPTCPPPQASFMHIMTPLRPPFGSKPYQGGFSGLEGPRHIAGQRSAASRPGPVEEDGGSVNMSGRPQSISNAESIEQIKTTDMNERERVEQGAKMRKRGDSDIEEDGSQSQINPILNDDQFQHNKDSAKNKNHPDRVNLRDSQRISHDDGLGVVGGFESHKQTSSYAQMDHTERGMNINKTVERLPSEDEFERFHLVNSEDFAKMNETFEESDSMTAVYRETRHDSEPLKVHPRSSVKFPLQPVAGVQKRRLREVDLDIQGNTEQPHGRSVAEGIQSKPQKDQEDNETRRMIRVRGLAKPVSQDALWLFFVNKKRSGGGEIESLEWGRSKSEVFITFKDPSVVQRVLEKQKRKPFHIEQLKLTVEEYVPTPPDPLRLFLKNLSPKVTQELLLLYLESHCNTTPSEILFGRLPGTALVTFSKPPDVGLLLRKVKEKSLDGHYIQVTRVPITCCVQVTGLPLSTTKDNVYLYFENAWHSGGGPVKDVKFGREKQSCFVSFFNAYDAKRVCTRSHTIDKKDIKVCLYYECLNDDLDTDI